MIRFELHSALALVLAAGALVGPAAAQRSATPVVQPPQAGPRTAAPPAPTYGPPAAAGIDDDLLAPLAPGSVDPRTDDDLLAPLDPSSVDPRTDDDLLAPLDPSSVDPRTDEDLLAPLDPSSVDPRTDDDLLAPLIPLDPFGPTREEMMPLPLTPEEKARVDAMLREMGLTISDEAMALQLRDAQERLAQRARQPRPRTPRTPRYVIPRDLDFTDYLRVKEEQENAPRQAAMIRRVRVDPCGDFEVSWGGRKTCHPREIIYYELGYEDEAPPPPPPESERDREARERELFGSSGLGSSGTLGGSNASSGTFGGSLGGAPAPSSGLSASPGSSPQTAGDAAASSSGGLAGPTAPINTPLGASLGEFRRVGTFEARLDSVSLDTRDRLDVMVTLRPNAGGPSRLVANGDWIAVGSDADGVGSMTTAIWMPTGGVEQAFPIMPNLRAGELAQVRFLIPMEPGHAGVSTVAFHQRDGGTALFDLSSDASFAAQGAPGPAPAETPPVVLTAFDVRVDAVQLGATGTTELFFTATNHTDGIQYLGGTRLRFRATTPQSGEVESLGQTYFIRGRRDRPVDMIVVPPGRSARLRVVFDIPSVRGLLTITDGQATATVAAPAAPEPEW